MSNTCTHHGQHRATKFFSKRPTVNDRITRIRAVVSSANDKTNKEPCSSASNNNNNKGTQAQAGSRQGESAHILYLKGLLAAEPPVTSETVSEATHASSDRENGTSPLPPPPPRLPPLSAPPPTGRTTGPRAPVDDGARSRRPSSCPSEEEEEEGNSGEEASSDASDADWRGGGW